MASTAIKLFSGTEALFDTYGEHMAKPFNEWTVLSHGELTRLDDRMLVVTGFLQVAFGAAAGTSAVAPPNAPSNTAPATIRRSTTRRWRRRR
jgi:hypothetical protein